MVRYDPLSDSRELDESIGTLGAYIKTWGEKDAEGNTLTTYFKKLETVPCEKSAINFDGDENEENYSFYSPSAESAYDVKQYYKELNCIKNDD